MNVADVATVAAVAAVGYWLMNRAPSPVGAPSGGTLDPLAQAIEAITKKTTTPDFSSSRVLEKPPGYWGNVCDVFGCNY